MISSAEAAIDANAPLPDDLHDPSAPVDSDEEKDLVMAAIGRSCPRPLAQHVFVPARKKYPYVRMKEMLSQALGGRNSGGNFPGGLNSVFGNGLFGAGGITGDGDEVERRASVVSSVMRGSGGSVVGGGPPSRKASVVATI